MTDFLGARKDCDKWNMFPTRVDQLDVLKRPRISLGLIPWAIFFLLWMRQVVLGWHPKLASSLSFAESTNALKRP
jgi:hypothetical protein